MRSGSGSGCRRIGRPARCGMTAPAEHRSCTDSSPAALFTLSRPVMLATVIGCNEGTPLLSCVPGFASSMLLKLMLVLNGTLGPALYMSLPWMRSYMTPNPPRTNGLARSGQIIGKANARTECCPVIVDQALRNSRCLAGDADAVQVELVAGQDGIRAGAQARTSAAECCSRLRREVRERHSPRL